MKLSIINSKSKTKDINLSDAVFGNEFNEDLVHQAVTTYLAGARQGSHKQKTRSEVRGGGRKPYRQKGTGRARAGTIRSPIWRGGGVTFASTPRDYSKKINKKMYRAAIRSILSELLRQDMAKYRQQIEYNITTYLIPTFLLLVKCSSLEIPRYHEHSEQTTSRTASSGEAHCFNDSSELHTLTHGKMKP